MIGPDRIGDLVLTGYEFPWFSAEFEPTDSFAAYRPYFAWRACLDLEGEGEEDPIGLIRKVREAGGVRVRESPDGEVMPVTIHFDGEYASATFRY